MGVSEGLQVRWVIDDREAVSIAHDRYTYSFSPNGVPQKIFLSRESLASNVDMECAILTKRPADLSTASVSSLVMFVYTEEGAKKMRERAKKRLGVINVNGEEVPKLGIITVASLLNGQLVSVQTGLFLSTGAVKPTIQVMTLPVSFDKAVKLLREAGFEPVIFGEGDKLPIYTVPHPS